MIIPGPGWLCLTYSSVACEVDGRGLYLDFVPRALVCALDMLGRSPSGMRFRLSSGGRGRLQL